MKNLLLSALMCAMLTAPAMADEGVSVYSNGNLVADKGIILEGRTLVPVRGVFEYMGYTAEWDADTKTATLKSDKNTVVIKNGDSDFTVNGNTVTPDVPAQIIEGRFMLPLRAVGEAVDAEVSWDAESRTAEIKSKATVIETPLPGVSIEITSPDAQNDGNVNYITIE